MSTKIQGYVSSLLQNPEFIKVAAKRYGELQSAGGAGLVPNLSMVQLAKAVHDLETALIDLEPETNWGRAG